MINNSFELYDYAYVVLLVPRSSDGSATLPQIAIDKYTSSIFKQTY